MKQQKGVMLKIAPEINDYQEEGLKLRIENGWFEEPPRSVERRELVNEPKH